jgi:hypothetical protein
MLRSLLAGACFLGLLSACATGHDQRSASAAAPDHGPMCVSATGERMPAKSGSCSVYGRSWSREDLERSGQPDVGQALQQIDPSVTVQHH